MVVARRRGADGAGACRQGWCRWGRCIPLDHESRVQVMHQRRVLVNNNLRGCKHQWWRGSGSHHPSRVSMSIVLLRCVLRRGMLPRLRSRIVVAMHLLIALHRESTVDRLVLGMRCEHAVVSGIRVRLVVIDLDLLRRHALYALHCNVVCSFEGYGIQ